MPITMTHDWLPLPAAMTAWISCGIAATTLQRQPLQPARREVNKQVEREEGAMKAVLLTNHGGPEMLRYGEALDPTAGPGEVVVDIHAASVNAADYKVRLGSNRSNLRFPYILGRDFSGVVSTVGAGVTDLTVGDAVFGVCHQGRDHCQEARPPGPCRSGRHGADQHHCAVGPRGYGAAQSGRNHFNSGR